MLRSHMEICNAAQAHLDEWYEHRTRLEAELSKLAWQFDKWGLDSQMKSRVLQSTESRAASLGPVVGVRSGAGMADGGAPREAAQAKSKCGRAVKEENITKWMDIVVGLLEHDRNLTDNLLKSIVALQTSEMVLSFKIQCGAFDAEGRDYLWTQPGTSANAEGNPISLAQRTKMPVIFDIIRALAFGLPWDLAGFIKGIKDLAVESPRSRSEAATQLHVFVACARLQGEDIRSLMMEYLAD